MTEPKYSVSRLLIPKMSGNGTSTAKGMGEPIHKVLRWLNGLSRPTRTQALSLFSYIDLDVAEGNQILAEWKYLPLTSKDNKRIWYEKRKRNITPGISSRQVVESARATNEVRNQISALEEKISSISDQLEEQGAGVKKGESKNIREDLDSLQEVFSELQESSMRMTAPVVFPEPKDMEVRLIASSSLERLEEYRSEENKWYSVLTLFVGAIFGVFVNLVTGGDLTAAAWILVGAFLLMGGFAGWSAFGFQKRAESIKRKINPDRNKEEEHKSAGSVWQ